MTVVISNLYVACVSFCVTCCYPFFLVLLGRTAIPRATIPGALDSKRLQQPQPQCLQPSTSQSKNAKVGFKGLGCRVRQGFVTISWRRLGVRLGSYLFNIGAEIITNTILGVPYCTYSIWAPQPYWK